MFYNVIPVLVILLSLGGILLIIGLKIPILVQQVPENALSEGEGEKEIAKKKRKFKDWFPGKQAIALFLEKLLRKIRLASMRAENLCSQWLVKLKGKHVLPTKKIEEVRIESVVSGDIDYSLREQELIKLITQDPRNASAYRKLADLYIKQENFKDALASFEQVLKLHPGDEEARKQIADLKERVGDVELEEK